MFMSVFIENFFVSPTWAYLQESPKVSANLSRIRQWWAQWWALFGAAPGPLPTLHSVYGVAGQAALTFSGLALPRDDPTGRLSVRDRGVGGSNPLAPTNLNPEVTQ